MGRGTEVANCQQPDDYFQAASMKLESKNLDIGGGCLRSPHSTSAPVILLVARITDPPVSAEGAELSDEVVISIGGILAILLGIFDQQVDRLVLVLGIVKPANRAAVGS
jgi:hypothetical protein